MSQQRSEPNRWSSEEGVHAALALADPDANETVSLRQLTNIAFGIRIKLSESEENHTRRDALDALELAE